MIFVASDALGVELQNVLKSQGQHSNDQRS